MNPERSEKWRSRRIRTERAAAGDERVRMWLSEPLPPTVRKAIERLARAPDVQRIAVMPDVHLAEGVCVGNVVATSRLIYPQAVGGDIGCGMAALAFDCDGGLLRDAERCRVMLKELARAVPPMRHPRLAEAPALPQELRDSESGRPALSDSSLSRAAERVGRVELGTLGRGNHFLEFQADTADRLWLMLHSGSRQMGQTITAFHVKHATPAGGGLFHLDAESDSGRAYLADLAWARHYSAANRRCMIERVCAVLERVFGTRPLWDTLLPCDHNHVQRETHGGREYWVHRKGAIRAGKDEPGIVPGSMGTFSLHVAGRGLAESLCSSAHGAGRARSRSESRARVQPRDLQAEMHGVVFDRRLTRQLCDEAPSAYKDLAAVMRAQRPLVRVVRQLRPLLVYKSV
jgi:tRNA-splicing ligase RtcB